MELASVRVHRVEVPEFGEVFIREKPETLRTRRIGECFDSKGQRIPERWEQRNIQDIIDQVCSDEKGTPMFNGVDSSFLLEQVGGPRLDPLIEAIQTINGVAEKNVPAGSNDGSENSDETTA